MGETLIERLTKTKDGKRLYHQERAIQEATELLCSLMAEGNIDRDDLAKRLNYSTDYIDLILDGQVRMTIRKLSDVFFALDQAVHFHAENGDDALQS